MKKNLFSTVMAAAITLSASAAFAQLTPVAPTATKPAVAAPAAPAVAKPTVPAAVKETAKPAAATAPAVATKEAKPASEAQLKQRAKMKECGAKWQEMKKTGANKGTSWKEFSPKCLKGEA